MATEVREQPVQILETLWEEPELTLARAARPGGPASLWVLACAAGAPAELRERLERELALAPALDPTWAVQPLALEEQAGEKRLILRDPGGTLLARCLTEAGDLRARLRLATSAAAALAALHERELIHADIRPANLVVEQASGSVLLRGFGRASRAPRKRQAEAPKGPPPATPEYMSPEQTGRMNRSVDARSDLYSLGLTLYELFAGKHPFSASEPLEWMHCHVARQPVPLHQLGAAIPEPVSAIVQKLLAKTPEDRYQTASGLEADLRTCLAQLERGELAPFALGTRDASPRLRIPERLYGRSRELALLAGALERVAHGGRTELVALSGYAGVGKSSLVNELAKTVLTTRSLFAAGKADQLKREIPYATLAEALRALVRGVLGQHDEQIAAYREALARALGRHGQIMVQLVPELGHIVGPQPAVLELPPEEAKARFQALFRSFVGVFATAEHPLVLFLDDLQWLDAESLALLTALSTGASQHLLLICAFRDHELDAQHPLRATLALWRAGDKPLHELVLAPLAPEELAALLSDALHATPERTLPLAHAIHEKTAGNPFFAIEFLTGLADEGLLTFDPAGQRWSWDLARIAAEESTDNVIALMVSKLDRLPESTQQVLKHLACLGRRASTARLAAVSGLGAREVDQALGEVTRTRLLYAADDGYAFSHDRVQEASYALIPEPERALTHLKIARVLSAALGDPALLDARGAAREPSNEELFEVVHQYEHGGTATLDAPEREQVAALLRRAGERAKTALARGAALAYFARGRALLGECWEQAYSLCLALALGQAECTFLTGDPGGAARLLSALAERARSQRDRAAVTCLRILVHSALDQNLEAVEVCLAYLREVGIDWTPHPSREQVLAEYAAIREQLAGRSVASLIDLPRMADPDRRATMDALTAVLPVALFVDEHLNSLALCRMVNLSLAYGNSDGSCFAYVMLGRVLGPYFGDPPAGFAFGQLAFDLLERPHMATYRARVSSVFGICVHPWTNPVESSLPLARRAFTIAQETGDITYAAYSCPSPITMLLLAGKPLAEVELEAEAGIAYCRSVQFRQMEDILVAQVRLIRALRGLTPNLGSFDGEGFDERAVEAHLAGNPSLSLGACWYWIRKLQGRFLAGDAAGAHAAAEQAGQLLWTSGSFLETVEYHTFAALALCALYDGAEPARAAEYRVRAGMHLAQLETWAAHCPSNFAARATLVAAECARVDARGSAREPDADARALEAMRLYEQAVAAAHAAGFVHDEALAHELAARFYAQRGLETSARAHFAAARAAYQLWGATGKQRQLDRLYPGLGQSAAEPARRAEPDNVDFATIVRTSQAVSHQVGHQKVVRSLMEVVVQHAGAERGLLLLEAHNEMRIEAEATTGDGVQVELSPAATQGALPESVLRYVLRTRDTVLLDDGLSAHQFAGDAYFARRGVRSVLCLPIQRQADLIGVLYLENNLSPYVFTRTRVEVLKLLASQAAIALENASLEEKEALLKEVHHRVKNNLQLISSLLNLQAARVGDPKVAELFADCRHRVRSMALVHENLYQAGNFSHIPMGDHIKTLCAHLGRAYGAQSRGVEIELAIEDIYLEMSRAITCGLIINELVSNALKHAFPEGRPGRVRVALSAPAGGRYALTIADDGVGMPAAHAFEHADSLGLQLVHDLSAQLHGSVSASGGPGGTSFRIEFALAGREMEISRGDRPDKRGGAR